MARKAAVSKTVFVKFRNVTEETSLSKYAEDENFSMKTTRKWKALAKLLRMTSSAMQHRNPVHKFQKPCSLTSSLLRHTSMCSLVTQNNLQTQQGHPKCEYS